MVGAFLPQIVVCDPPEFVINQRNHGAQCLVVAGVPVLQQWLTILDGTCDNEPPEPPGEFLGSNLASRMTDVKPLKRMYFVS
jgi:hypothetical protein